jgi:tRNA(adenine34) deaminase
MQESLFGKERDEYFMSQALGQARKAIAQNEVPVGAVIVSPEGKIFARAYNAVEKEYSQCAHAELLAIAKAGKKLHNWRLEGYWIYVTLQPCIMCMALIRLSRLNGIVYGATSPLFGSGLDVIIPSQVYKSDIAIVGGVLQQQAAVLLKEFFQNKRKEKG